MTVKILIVEDDETKLAIVRDSLETEVVAAPLQIEVATNALEAKRKLKKVAYDLVILDVALPPRTKEDVDPRGGIKLLREVLNRKGYHTPRYVIGLTALRDIYQTAAAEFAEDLWSLVYFDSASDEWLGRIERKILHIASLYEVKSDQDGFDFDVCIVAALQDELDPLLRNGWDWKQVDILGDASIYYEAIILDGQGNPYKIIAAKSAMMGMAAASALTMKMGLTFKPRTVIMIGVCAGDSSATQFGDVVVGSPVWDYGNGKHFADESGAEAFKASIYQIAITAGMRGLVERIAQDGEKLRICQDAFSGDKPRGQPNIIVGPLASGASVVANRSKFESIQDKQHRKLIGIEMEAYGVMLAAQELPHPRPEVLILKSVQDYADKEKDDRYRLYACYTSSMVATMAIDDLAKKRS